MSVRPKVPAHRMIWAHMMFATSKSNDIITTNSEIAFPAQQMICPVPLALLQALSLTNDLLSSAAIMGSATQFVLKDNQCTDCSSLPRRRNGCLEAAGSHPPSTCKIIAHSELETEGGVR